MTPYQIGAWAGAGIVGAVSGAVQGISEAVDFAGLLSSSQSAETQTATTSESLDFEGLNDRHRSMAEERVKLRDALEALATQLSQLTRGADVEIGIDASGQWQVSGDSQIRAQLEEVLANDPAWQENWQALQESIAQLQSIGVDGLSNVPVSDERLSSQRTFIPGAGESSSFDLRLRQRDDQLSAVLL